MHGGQSKVAPFNLLHLEYPDYVIAGVDETGFQLHLLRLICIPSDVAPEMEPPTAILGTH